MWYNSPGVELPPLASLPQFATSEQIAAPCKGKRFCCKTEWCCKKHSLLCSGEHKSFLSEEERTLRGKRGLTTGGKQTTHSPVGWRKVRLLRNLLYINNISQIAPNDSHLYTWGGTKGKRAVDDGEMTDCLTERPIGQVTNQTVSHCNVGVADQPTKRITFCSDSLFIVRLFPWLVIR